MFTSYDIIKALIRTEKSTLSEPMNKYLFLVDNSSNKIQIKRAVEEIYKVKVKDVNTVIYRGKIRRVRREAGKAADKKKAMVTLKEGHKIVVT